MPVFPLEPMKKQGLQILVQSTRPGSWSGASCANIDPDIPVQFFCTVVVFFGGCILEPWWFFGGGAFLRRNLLARVPHVRSLYLTNCEDAYLRHSMSLAVLIGTLTVTRPYLVFTRYSPKDTGRQKISNKPVVLRLLMQCNVPERSLYL